MNNGALDTERHTITALTQCDLTVNGCDWHMNKGNDERFVLHLTRLIKNFSARNMT